MREIDHERSLSRSENMSELRDSVTRARDPLGDNKTFRDEN